MAETATKLRRRFLRFSLRALLLLMLVIGSALGWTLHKVREQRIAVAALESVGCSFEYGSDFKPLTVAERMRTWFGEEHPDNVTVVYGARSQLSDAGMVHLRVFTELEHLDLSNTRVTDAGLVHVRALTQLEWLSLSDTPVTDAGLVHLRGSKNLAFLYLSGTRVTPNAINDLNQALPNLTR